MVAAFFTVMPWSDRIIILISKSRQGPNVSTTPITAMGCRQCLPLSVVQLKGKHCRKPHCRNGVVDTFRQVRCECTVPLSASSSATLVYATSTLQRHHQYSGNVAAAVRRRRHRVLRHSMPYYTETDSVTEWLNTALARPELAACLHCLTAFSSKIYF
jgi:hypothetical protein